MSVAQKILPLLDGNVASAVSNLLAPRGASPSPAANLAPIEHALGNMQTEHRELRSQMAEQTNSIKRVVDQLEMVKEATNRNTLEQQELMDDLRGFRKKAIVFACVGLGLLVISIAANVFFYLRIEQNLH